MSEYHTSEKHRFDIESMLFKIFRWFCDPELVNVIEGDLMELNAERTKEMNERKATFLLFIDILMLFRPSIIRSVEGSRGLNQYGLFKNHFKISCRFMQKHRGFTAINLAGLSLAFLVVFYTIIYVHFESSYDSFHEHVEDIYRLVTDVHSPTKVSLESSSLPMAPAIAADFPEVNDYTRVILDFMIIESSKETYRREDAAYADPSIFSMFTFPLISGDPKTALETPYGVVLSEDAAEFYFETNDCIGKQLLLDGGTTVYVTGVMENMPVNAHFRVDVLLSLALLTEVWNPSKKDKWQSLGVYTYLHLDGNTAIDKLSNQITKMVDGHLESNDDQYMMFLEPLQSIYLKADPRGYRTGSSRVGSLSNLYSLSVIGLFILCIALFNFINLSTALSLSRVKEVGMRKILGISNSTLVFQLIVDTLLFSLFALMLALILAFILFPFFNQISGQKFSTDLLFYWDEIKWMLSGVSLIGLFTGIYPARFLSKISSTKSLKGKNAVLSKGLGGRKILVIGQFMMSFILIVSTMVVYQQIGFMHNKELGYDKNQKLVLDFYFDDSIRGNSELVKTELLKVPGVNEVTMSSCVPGMASRRYDAQIKNSKQEWVGIRTAQYLVDHDFLEVFKIEMIAGRRFNPQVISDQTNAIILNESAAEMLGFSSPSEVIGVSYKQGRSGLGKVIGVVKNFHMESARKTIEPLVIRMGVGRFPMTLLTLSTDSSSDLMSRLQNIWPLFQASRPFSYHFMDEQFHAQYAADERFMELIFFMAGLAVFISVLGLLGLTAFSTTQRTKEISIRKILGASPNVLFGLLTKEIMTLVLMAMGVGIPVAVIGLKSWLDDYAYHVALDWRLFGLAAFMIVVVSMITMAGLVWRSVSANPVDALKSE